VPDDLFGRVQQAIRDAEGAAARAAILCETARILIEETRARVSAAS
jgi:hypothetical protein